MVPIALILGAASLAGGIMQAAGGKKMIDPEWLKQHFGAGAVTEEMITLFNQIVNSPYGQQAMSDAASQGTQFESALRSNTAQTGLSAGEGGSSGASIFSDSAAGGATKSLQGQVRSGIFQQTLPIAANIVNSRLAAYMGQPAMSEPSSMSKFGAALGGAAAAGLQNVDWGSKAPAVRTENMGEGSIGITRPNDAANPLVPRSALMASATNTNAVQPSRFRASVGGYV